LFTASQVFFASRIKNFPDLIVILVVYAGIFYELKNVLIFACLAGVLRGVFSPETISGDIFVFPMLGGMAYAVGKLFNRNNPAGGILITVIGLLFVMLAHTLMLNSLNNNNVSVFYVIAVNWKSLLLSAVTYPLMFLMFNISLKRKKDISEPNRIFY
jgi:cell shape-determining protein MreD